MQELISFIVENLVTNKDAFTVSIEGEKITILVDKEDIGRVIGRQGKTAKAIRTIVKSAAFKDGVKYQVEINSREEAQQ